MKRIAVLSAWLTLGALTNIIIATASVFSLSLREIEESYYALSTGDRAPAASEAELDWLSSLGLVLDSERGVNVEKQSAANVGASVECYHLVRWLGQSPNYIFARQFPAAVYRVRAGIPFTSFDESICTDGGTKWALLVDFIPKTRVIEADRLPDHVPMPLRLRPGGFIGNTLIFAALLFAVFTITTTTIRRCRAALRLQQGRCPICRYVLIGGTAIGCSECGWRRAN